ASITPATRIAAARPGATILRPSRGCADNRTRTARPMISKPFGVLENRRTATRVLFHTGSFVPLQRGRDDQSVHAEVVEQANTFEGAQHEHRRCESIRKHCCRSDNGGAGNVRGRRSGAWIQNVMLIGFGRMTPFVITRCAHSPSRNREYVDQFAVNPRVPDT